MGRIQDQFQVRKIADEEIPTSSETVLDAIHRPSRQFSDHTNRSVLGIEESEDFQVLRLSRASESRGAVFQGSKRVDTPFFIVLFEIARNAAFIFARVRVLALAPEMPAGGVVRDAEDPGRKTRSALVGGNRPVDLKEGLLRDVFGIGSVATASHRKAEDAVAVFLVELLETSHFTVGESFDERLVGMGGSHLSRIFHDFAPDL